MSVSSTRSAEPAPAIEAVDIVKSYGAVSVLKGVSIAVRPGEVVALAGENGAGKSTLVSILAGTAAPNSGQVRVNGAEVRLTSPTVARAHGIETVFQDLALAPHLDIAANFFLGREIRAKGIAGRLGFLDTRSMRAKTASTLQEIQATVPDITRLVSALSGGQRQSIAIGRAASWASSLLILDEPTAALGVEESAKVNELIRTIRDRGIPVLLISHNMPQIMSVADRVVVLRLGKMVADLSTSQTHEDEIVSYITGSYLAGERAG